MASERKQTDQNPKDYYKRFHSKIPFLNGGLFEPMNQYDWKNINLIIPNSIFSNKTLISHDEQGNGILDIFKRYNFTVNEDEPLDTEVAVDPEMLGKVFENLLEVTDRKSKGAFYTPREIVHYMCSESLINYLENRLENSVPKKDIETFIHKGALLIENEQYVENRQKETKTYTFKLSESIRKNAKKIDKALENVKICDPAIGSGAFPMGLLHEIVTARQVINAYLKTDISTYQLKKHAIYENIYGVDIEKSAVDIARLRFWLSLIIDDTEPKPLPNLDYKIMQGNSLLESFEGIDLSRFTETENKPKTELFEDHSFEGEINFNENKKAVAELMKSYFKETCKIKKQEIQGKIDNIINTFLKNTIEKEEQKIQKKIPELQKQITDTQAGSTTTQAKKKKKEKDLEKLANNLNKKIKELNSIKNKKTQLLEIQKTKEKPYFLWNLFFKEVFDKGGFDIVIGNPPYIQLQKAIPGSNLKFADLYKNAKYQTFERTGDIYALFYEKGTNLLKENGIISYITSNKWMRANYGKSLREFFALKNPLKLIDLGPGVFETATVDTNIIFVQNKKTKQHQLKAITLNKNITELDKQDFTLMDELSEESWVILSETEKLLKQKIENIGTPLKDWDINIYRGVLTGYNEAFIINGATKDRLIEQDPKSAEIIKPILRGRDIKRYKAEFADLWLINSHNGVKADHLITKNIKKPYYKITDDFGIEILKQKAFEIPPVNINDYPAVKKHLSQYWDRLKRRDDKGITPYNLRNCAYIQEFEKEKIVWGSVSETYYTFVEKILFY